MAPNFPANTQSPGWDRARDRGGYRLKAVHDYGGFVLLRWRHPSTKRKRLSWERRDPSGVWIPGLGGTRLADLPLYDERQLRYAIGSGERIIVVESESSVDTLTKKGLYATTWAGGAQNPPLGRLAASLAAMTVLGSRLTTAVLGALICSTVLLGAAGWAIGRGGRLPTGERIASTLFAGLFGVLFILLKTLLH